MSLNWEWKEKCGEITLEQFGHGDGVKEFPITLYKGNAFLIMLHEFKDEESDKDMYNMFGFFLDKEHAKNCLGLNKKRGYGENIYQTDYQRFSKLRINKNKYPYTKDLVQMFVQAFDNIDIEIVSEGA